MSPHLWLPAVYTNHLSTHKSPHLHKLFPTAGWDIRNSSLCNNLLLHTLLLALWTCVFYFPGYTPPVAYYWSRWTQTPSPPFCLFFSHCVVYCENALHQFCVSLSAPGCGMLSWRVLSRVVRLTNKGRGTDRVDGEDRAVAGQLIRHTAEPLPHQQHLFLLWVWPLSPLSKPPFPLLSTKHSFQVTPIVFLFLYKLYPQDVLSPSKDNTFV